MGIEPMDVYVKIAMTSQESFQESNSAHVRSRLLRACVLSKRLHANFRVLNFFS